MDATWAKGSFPAPTWKLGPRHWHGAAWCTKNYLDSELEWMKLYMNEAI